jgi:predicted lipoprotein with Yx(FWY)xxD motif
MKRPVVALLAALLLSGLAVSATALGGRTTTVSRAVVKVGYNKTLKKSIVVDGSGRSLYMFTQDTKGKATCASADPQCPTLWPAFKTSGKPLAGKGINASLLGTTKGAGGVQQVTYNRHPLYYWHGNTGFPGDKKPGDVKGQGFYNLWYVLSPKGTPIYQ